MLNKHAELTRQLRDRLRTGSPPRPGDTTLTTALGDPLTITNQPSPLSFLQWSRCWNEQPIFPVLRKPSCSINSPPEVEFYITDFFCLKFCETLPNWDPTGCTNLRVWKMLQCFHSWCVIPSSVLTYVSFQELRRLTTGLCVRSEQWTEIHEVPQNHPLGKISTFRL